jgi:hypothetical protein
MRGALVAGCVPPGEGLGHPTRNGGVRLGNRAVAAGSRVKQRPKAIPPDARRRRHTPAEAAGELRHQPVWESLGRRGRIGPVPAKRELKRRKSRAQRLVERPVSRCIS